MYLLTGIKLNVLLNEKVTWNYFKLSVRLMMAKNIRM